MNPYLHAVATILAFTASLGGRAQTFAGEPKPVPPARTARIEDFAPAEEFVQAGGVKTHVVRKGDKGTPIVLIHGFGSCTYTWRRNIDALAKEHRVFAVDLKGFGLTEKPKDGRYHLAAYAEHLLATIDALQLDRPILVGNSMGGAVIARLALLRPDRVGGVVLVDAAPPNWRPPAIDRPEARPPASSLADRFKVALAKTLISRKMIETGLRSAYHDPSNVTPDVVDAHYIPFTIEGAPEALIAMTNPPRDSGPTTPPLKELKPPALIVWGRHDRIIPVAVAELFARELPRAKKVVLEMSGHLPHEEEPDQFNKLVAEFAAGAAGATDPFRNRPEK